MTISYVIDVYRRDIQPTTQPASTSRCSSRYFPHLVAGPILRASLLLPQIARPRAITQRADRRRAVADRLWGCFQKMFVADNLAPLADAVFSPPASPTGLDVLLAIYAFAFQIYGDFAGYSDIARGMSKLMGIELNVNFLFPYFVVVAAGVLAQLAHQPVDLAARLSLHSAGRQPRLGLATKRQSDDHDGARRAVARRGVDVRAVGRLSGLALVRRADDRMGRRVGRDVARG